MTDSVSDEDIQSYSFREMPYKEPGITVVKEGDGSVIIDSTIALVDIEPSIPALFKRRAKEHPQRTWLAEKDSEGHWREISYSQFDERSDCVAQWLIDQGMNQHTALMILSENSIDHAIVSMAAMKAKVPVAPVSAPYSLLDPALKKLRSVVEILKPSVLFAQCGKRYAHAIEQLTDHSRRFIVSDNPGNDHIAFHKIINTKISDQVEQSIESITAQTVAKYMFTSGSTGSPKCVVQTQLNLCAQVAGIASVQKPSQHKEHGPVSLQWMPWSHVSAGNISYHEAILNGGTIYIDDGRPMPGLFEKTIDNLRQISPSVFGSAPLGLSYLVTALESDTSLQNVFFKNLEAIAYGGSALPEDICRRIQRLSVKNIGKRMPIISMYGSTETQGITATYWPTDLPGVIGLPMPGMTLKLVPCANKLEVRVKGPTVFSGYYSQDTVSTTLFDEQGFFKLGDAAKFADNSDPLKGLIFDGRISEDFKLLSGTWVCTASVKSQLLKAFGALVRDVVVCGENKSFVSVFAWLDKDAAAEFVGDKSLDMRTLISDPRIEQSLDERLRQYNQHCQGSSTRVRKIMLLKDLPSLSKSEINEKGYINSSVLVANYGEEFERLYGDDSDGALCVLNDLD